MLGMLDMNILFICLFSGVLLVMSVLISVRVGVGICWFKFVNRWVNDLFFDCFVVWVVWMIDLSWFIGLVMLVNRGIVMVEILLLLFVLVVFLGCILIGVVVISGFFGNLFFFNK